MKHIVSKIVCIVAFCSLAFGGLNAQDYPYDIYHYNFVRYDKNKFFFGGDSSNFEKLFDKLDTLILQGKGQINILQLGASHTQADVMSGQIRRRLQTMFPGLNAGLGYVFPYKITKTNTPVTYFFRYTGEWQSCRNVEWRKKQCDCGLTGISATTYDSSATLTLILKNRKYPKHHFNRIKILHDTSPASFDIVFRNDTSAQIQTFVDKGYTLIKTQKFYDTLRLAFKKNSDTQYKFTLYGISLETDEPGIIYHAIGVNGASTRAYLRCDKFKQQLEVFKPDWVIIALGTNDGYTRNFSPEIYEANYDSLLRMITEVIPNAAITLVAPNDDYYRRRYPNKATEKQEKVINKLSKRYNAAAWSMYSIMGGYNSSVLWYKANLMARDHIHFTVPGYNLLGNLFFNAFLKAYDNHIEKKFNYYKNNSL